MNAPAIPVKPNAVVEVGGQEVRAKVKIGNALPIAFLAGPCVFEGRQHALDCAGFLSELFGKLGCGFVYKSSFDKANRSSLSGVRGAGLDAAGPVFAEIRKTFGAPVVTDVHLPEQCAEAAEFVDMLQIPAFLCRQTDLLIAAAQTGKPINVKKGQFLAPWDMKHVVAKILGSGNPNVLTCERGASFGYNTLVSDFRALPILKELGSPVVFDATHSVQQPGGMGDRSGGERKHVPVLARAAASIGVAAIFIEAHPDPDKAPSDGPNMVPFAGLPALVETLLKFDRLAKSLPA